MTGIELIQIISHGESETVEFKATGKLLITTVGKLVTSFLNSKGGYIVIGVRGPDEIVGIDDDQVTRLKNFTIRVVLRNIKPKTTVKFSTVDISGKTVVVIEVPEGKDKPYGYSGTYFKREGEIVVEMAQIDILDFFGSQEKYDKHSISEILEKVKAIEMVLRKKSEQNWIKHIHKSWTPS